jgi:hypothetical protein
MKIDSNNAAGRDVGDRDSSDRKVELLKDYVSRSQSVSFMDQSDYQSCQSSYGNNMVWKVSGQSSRPNLGEFPNNSRYLERSPPNMLHYTEGGQTRVGVCPGPARRTSGQSFGTETPDTK